MCGCMCVCVVGGVLCAFTHIFNYVELSGGERGSGNVMFERL